MEPWQLSYIRENKNQLMKNIICNSLLLNELASKGILVPHEVERINILLTSKGKIDAAYELFENIQSRRDAYDILITALASPDIGQSQAAEILRRGKEAQNLEVPESLNLTSQIPPTLPPTTSLRQTETTPVPVGPVNQDVVDAAVNEYIQVHLRKPLYVQVELPRQNMRQQFEAKDYYKLPEEGKGFALIINIKTFQKYEVTDGEEDDPNQPDLTRHGAERDGKYMKDLWKNLGYKIFREDEIDWEDEIWYKEDMLEVVQAFKAFCNRTRPKSIVVFIGSHGQQNEIFTSDPPSKRELVINLDTNEYQYEYTRHKIKLYENVISNFYHNSCHGLKDKPKMFFVSACQNFPVEQDSLLGAPVSDMVVCMAQAPGFSAFRSGRGSWFAHCLTFVMMKYAKEKSLQEMLAMVSKFLENVEKSAGVMMSPNGEQTCLPYGQIPEIRYVGMQGKELYFNLKS